MLAVEGGAALTRACGGGDGARTGGLYSSAGVEAMVLGIILGR